MPQVRIESLSRGPHAIARVEGKVHLVRGGAPGDLATIEATEDKGTFSYARMATLHEAGPDRREAPCPYLPECGGCGWQHIDEEAQRSAKQKSIEETFSRTDGLTGVSVDPILAADHALAYRRRLSLRVEGKRVGFFAGGSHDLIPIENCLLGIPELEGGIEIAQQWVRRLETRINRIELAWTGESNRMAVIGQCDGPLADGDRGTSEAMLREEPRLASIVLHGRGFYHVLGIDRITVALPTTEMHVRAGAFSQVTDTGNHQLIATMLGFVRATPETRIADLYAGGGNLSIPLALTGASVVGIERDRRGIEALRANAERLGLENLEGRVGHVHRTLPKFPVGSFDLVVLDPPRSGAAEAIEELIRLAPDRIVYVSCNPTTLARDLGRLVLHYEVENVLPIDLFPQTPHTEAVASLKRRDGKDHPA